MCSEKRVTRVDIAGDCPTPGFKCVEVDLATCPSPKKPKLVLYEEAERSKLTELLDFDYKEAQKPFSMTRKRHPQNKIPLQLYRSPVVAAPTYPHPTPPSLKNPFTIPKVAQNSGPVALSMPLLTGHSVSDVVSATVDDTATDTAIPTNDMVDRPAGFSVPLVVPYAAALHQFKPIAPSPSPFYTNSQTVAPTRTGRRCGRCEACTARCEQCHNCRNPKLQRKCSYRQKCYK